MDVELLPCPFCNAPAEIDTDQAFRAIVTGDFEKSVAIYCTACAVQMQHCYSDHRGTPRETLANDLVERWNARAAVAPNRPVVDDEMIRRARSAWFEEAYKEGGKPYRVGDANWRAALQAALGAEHG